MARKKHESAACLWKYGCKSPRGEGADILRAQMRSAHNYRNQLVALERQRREEFYALERELFPDFAAQQESVKELESKVEELRTAWKRENAKSRSKTENVLLKSQIETAKTALKEARDALKVTKETVRQSEILSQRQLQIGERHSERVKELRKETDLFWGNIGFVDQAAQSMKSGAPPIFLRWEGEGFVGVTFRTPITPEKLFSGDNTRAWLEPCKPSGNKAGRCKKTTLHIAVQSADNRKLVMASIPIFFHRDFPEGCEITNVRLFCRKIGQREDWSAVFMLRLPTIQKQDRADSGSAAIHFGWRRVPEGLLVATVVDYKGETESLTLPEDVIESFAYSDKVRAIRDHLWNETITVLGAFLKKNRDAIPVPIAEAAKDLHQWKRHGRLVHLINVWKENRFPGDAEMFEQLTRKGTADNKFHDAGWIHRDKHLWDIESGVRNKATGKRKHLYREFAAQMRRKHRDLHTTKLNLKQIQATPNPEEEKDAAMTHYSRTASIGVLTQSLSDSLGSGWHVINATPVASVCNACGEAISQSGDMFHVCENCGETLHVEQNACKNILVLSSQLLVTAED